MNNRKSLDETDLHSQIIRDYTERFKPILKTESEDFHQNFLEEINNDQQFCQKKLSVLKKDLQQVQQDLELIQKEFNTFYDVSPVGYITLTEDGSIIKTNLTGAHILGSIKDNLINTRFRSYIAPKNLVQWDLFFFQVLHIKERQTCQIHLIGQDGTSVFTSIVGNSNECENGLSHIWLIIEDISIQQETNRKLYLNSQSSISLLGFYQRKFDSEFEFLKHVLEVCLKVSQSGIGFVGLISDDEQMMYGHAWSSDVMESCQVQSVPLHFPIPEAGIWADSIRLKKAVIVNDYDLVRLNGNFLPKGHLPIKRMISIPVIIEEHVIAILTCANKKSPYDDDDEKALSTLAYTAWELINHRRTEQEIRFKEKRLRIAQHIAGIGSLTYDYNVNSVIISEEMYKICAIDSRIWTGTIEDFFSYVHPDDLAMVQTNFKELISKGGRKEFEHRIIRPDGTVRWVRTIKEKIIEENKSSIEGVLHDITDRKQSELDMIQAFTQISKNAETLAILNDEIRNPLAIILAISELENSSFKETIFQSVREIDQIIDKLDQGWLESLKIRKFLKDHHGF